LNPPDPTACKDIEVIAIGASAGGLECLGYFFRALNPLQLPPVLVVQHIHRTTMDIADYFAQIPCVYAFEEAQDKGVLQANRICFAPPNFHLYVERDCTLSLSVDPPVCYSRPSIDVLFESVAKVFHSKCMGIVFSGANSDGAIGLGRIKKAGGYTIVQDPLTAAFSAMPEAAIAHTTIDFISTIEGITDRLKAIFT
jgi:two-component system chemotaxis response regulator CheB